MYFDICADPDCPNKARVEALEEQLRIARESLKLLEEATDRGVGETAWASFVDRQRARELQKH